MLSAKSKALLITENEGWEVTLDASHEGISTKSEFKGSLFPLHFQGHAYSGNKNRYTKERRRLENLITDHQ